MILRTVVIGCGWAGMKSIHAIRSNENALLAAVVDVDEARAKKAASEYNVPYFTTAEDCLGSGISFDAACVCTLPETHFDLCERLLKKGKNVFCEKPLSRNSYEMEHLYSTARDNNVKLSVNFNQRFGKAAQRARALIAKDGAIHLVTGSMYQYGYAYRQSSKYHILTDSCCHLFDTVCMLCGRAKSVCTLAAKFGGKNITDVSVLLEFENSAIGTVSHTYVGGRLDTQHPFQRIEVHTDQARYVIENLYDRLEIYPHREANAQVWQPSVFERRDYEDSMQESFKHFVELVLINGENTGSMQDVLHVSRLIEAAVRSAESGVFEKIE